MRPRWQYATRNTGPSPAVRALVKARNGGMCLCCSEAPGDQIHHRLPRAMGGTDNPVVNRPDALVWICFLCHSDIEMFRGVSYARGWLVKHGLDEPHEVPLTDLRGFVFFLTEEGEVVPLSGPNQPPF